MKKPKTISDLIDVAVEQIPPRHRKRVRAWMEAEMRRGVLRLHRLLQRGK